MRLLVTGASGFIGGRLCELALAQGHEVVGLVRPTSAARVPAGVVRELGSLPYDVRESAVAQCDMLLHLAAVTTADRAGESAAVNELGTAYLIHMAQKHGKAFLFMSTQSTRSSNMSAYAVTKRNSERLVRESTVPWVILRPGLVYGPGASGLYGRMKDAVKKLPVLPLLGGGKAIVQPIHVDDLCHAILEICSNVKKFSGSELNLGSSEGLSLQEFLLKIARLRGKNPRPIVIPLGPVKLAVSAGEKLRLPMPISMDNLRGLETVELMETAESHNALGLQLRDLDGGMAELDNIVSPQIDDRVPVLLIGAGKIGIVHGLQLMHNPHARLLGIVEPSAKAAKLYESMGFKGPFFSSIDQALEHPDPPLAAIVATPADTHLSVAQRCLEANLHLLVEKPLSVNTNQTLEWRKLREAHPDKIIHAGYMAAQFPHLLTAFHVARMNKLGHVYRAKVVALQTHITASEPVRWEMIKSRSGGGALINFGCHVLSILFRLLGWPDSEVTGWQWPVYSTEVEDSLVAKFSIKATQCTLLCSWSAPGYARPYNLVELECEHGVLRVENSATYILQDGEVALMETQQDTSLTFNMSPDYTGGGFTLEHEAFIGSVKAINAGKGISGWKPDFMPPVELAEALRLENWIQGLYQVLPFERPPDGTLDFWQIEPKYIQALGSTRA